MSPLSPQAATSLLRRSSSRRLSGSPPPTYIPSISHSFDDRPIDFLLPSAALFPSFLRAIEVSRFLYHLFRCFSFYLHLQCYFYILLLLLGWVCAGPGSVRGLVLGQRLFSYASIFVLGTSVRHAKCEIYLYEYMELHMGDAFVSVETGRCVQSSLTLSSASSSSTHGSLCTDRTLLLNFG